MPSWRRSAIGLTSGWAFSIAIRLDRCGSSVLIQTKSPTALSSSLWASLRQVFSLELVRLRLLKDEKEATSCSGSRSDSLESSRLEADDSNKVETESEDASENSDGVMGTLPLEGRIEDAQEENEGRRGREGRDMVS